LKREAPEPISQRTKRILHVDAHGQESLSTVQCSPRPAGSRSDRSAADIKLGDATTSSSEGPRVIETLDDMVITMDVAVDCASAYAILRREGAKAAVAVNRHRAPAGVLSNPTQAPSGDQGPTAVLSRLGRVGDHLQCCDFSVPCDTLLVEAASTMLDNGLQWLPVTCRGEVAGLLGAMDIVRWVAEFCGALPPANPELPHSRGIGSDEHLTSGQVLHGRGSVRKPIPDEPLGSPS
jgi:hypothetical protein